MWLRVGRYLVASAVATSLTEVCFLALYRQGLAGPLIAGGVGFVAGALPKYVLVRWWVWRRLGTPGLLDEMLPYTVVAAGTGLGAGWLTGVAEETVRAHIASPGLEVWGVGATFLSIMAAMFLVRYVLFDKLVFSDRLRTSRSGS